MILDDKARLHGLARKDLLASLSFFKEGVARLYGSLETPHKNCNLSTPTEPLEDQSEVEGATAMPPVTQSEHDVAQRVSDLSELIGNLNIVSQYRYTSAQKSFEEAKRLATEAFNNGTLSTEDRIMSSKLRIASRVLECLDDPEAAVRDCLLYLKELQDLPAVQAMFSVSTESDKRISSRVRAFLNKTERNVCVESILMINALLIDLAMKYTNIKIGVLDWPTIKTGKTSYYHPLLNDNSLFRKIQNMKAKFQLPWLWQLSADYLFHSALTGKGEFLYSTTSESDTIRRGNGECIKSFYTFPSETDGDIRFLSVDGNDNVHIVTEISTLNKDLPYRHELLILDAIGNVKAKKRLDIVEEKLSYGTIMNVTKDGTIVIYCNEKKIMYTCNSSSKKPDYKFPLPLKNVNPDDIQDVDFTVSNRNEIVYIVCKSKPRPSYFMYFTTIDGELKSVVELDLDCPSSCCEVNIAFNHVNETIIVNLFNYQASQKVHARVTTTIYNFSITGKFLCQLDIEGDCYYRTLISHPKGPVALLGGNEAVILQM